MHIWSFSWSVSKLLLVKTGTKQLFWSFYFSSNFLASANIIGAPSRHRLESYSPRSIYTVLEYCTERELQPYFHLSGVCLSGVCPSHSASDEHSLLCLVSESV